MQTLPDTLARLVKLSGENPITLTTAEISKTLVGKCDCLLCKKNSTSTKVVVLDITLESDTWKINHTGYNVIIGSFFYDETDDILMSHITMCIGEPRRFREHFHYIRERKYLNQYGVIKLTHNCILEIFTEVTVKPVFLDDPISMRKIICGEAHANDFIKLLAEAMSRISLECDVFYVEDEQVIPGLNLSETYSLILRQVMTKLELSFVKSSAKK